MDLQYKRENTDQVPMTTVKLETTQVMEQAPRENCAEINTWDIILLIKFPVVLILIFYKDVTSAMCLGLFPSSVSHVFTWFILKGFLSPSIMRRQPALFRLTWIVDSLSFFRNDKVWNYNELYLLVYNANTIGYRAGINLKIFGPFRIPLSNRPVFSRMQ